MGTTAINVALVGDSITKGYRVSDAESYPSALQSILKRKQSKQQFNVVNLGHNGATLCDIGSLPYRDTEEYSQLSTWKPDLIFFMLGTNDAAFPSFDEKSFETNLKKFVVEFLDLIEESINDKSRIKINNLLGSEAKKRLVLMIPPPVYVKEETHFIQNVIPNTIRQVSSTYGLADPIDLFAELGGSGLTLPQMFLDCIHPNAEGLAVIADKVAERIIALFKN